MANNSGHEDDLDPRHGRDYELDRYMIAGEWHDCNAGAPFPSNDQWEHIEMVTLNLDPSSEDGFHRNYNILGGLDVYDDPDGDYDLDDLAANAMMDYGFEV